MDIFLKKVLETTWGKSLLYTILGAMAGAIAWLAFENRRINEARMAEQSAARQEVLAVERQCAQAIEALNQRHIEFIHAALNRMEGLESAQRKRKR